MEEHGHHCFHLLVTVRVVLTMQHQRRVIAPVLNVCMESQFTNTKSFGSYTMQRQVPWHACIWMCAYINY